MSMFPRSQTFVCKTGVIGLPFRIRCNGEPVCLRRVVSPLILLSSLFLFWLCPSSLATLIICIYNRNQIYLASDSQVSDCGGKRIGSHNKIFPISQNCCIGLSGFCGGNPIQQSGGTFESSSLTRTLENLCREASANDAPLVSKMDAIATRLSILHCAIFSNEVPTNGTNQSHFLTKLQYAGYNATKHCFFSSSYMLDGTNGTHLEPVFERGSTNNECSVTFQGEDKFPSALLTTTNMRLYKLRSAAFSEVIDDLKSGNSVSDARIINFMLEIFKLHKEHSASMGYDDGWIGEPYLIYKITKEGIVQIH
jgi:hypothetical protein